MKNFRLSLAACALLLAVPLAACGTLADAATNTVVAASSTSNVQQHGLAAFENAYVIAGEGFLTYAKVAKPSAAVVADYKRLDNLVYAALVKARVANARGDSPAVAATLQALKGPLGDLLKYLTGLGVPVPALPAL